MTENARHHPEYATRLGGTNSPKVNPGFAGGLIEFDSSRNVFCVAFVIPAKAGNQKKKPWIPAFAGMTDKDKRRF